MVRFSPLVTATLLLAVSLTDAFSGVPTSFVQSRCCRTTSFNLGMSLGLSVEELFEDDEDMIPIVENYVHAKYKESAKEHGHEFCTEEDARDMLKSVLPPVSPQELDMEVSATMKRILNNSENTPQKINEECFAKAIVQNSYWKQAGDIVVKELMFLDALHSYYQKGSSLLNQEDYDDLKDNLVWEGSSVATMKADEALFVTAVASSRRGEPIMNDSEYSNLKQRLQNTNSWVTDREQDALEKLGLNTFLGYLHRAL